MIRNDATIPQSGRGWKPSRASLVLALTGVAALLLAVMLLRGHTTGGEFYGVMAAAVAVAAGTLSLRLVSGHGGRIGIAVASVLWITVIVLGVGGTMDHAKTVKPTSPDQRPRPALVPLVFSAMGLGGMTLVAAARGRPVGSVSWRLSHDQA